MPEQQPPDDALLASLAARDLAAKPGDTLTLEQEFQVLEAAVAAA